MIKHKTFTSIQCTNISRGFITTRFVKYLRAKEDIAWTNEIKMYKPTIVGIKPSHNDQKLCVRILQMDKLFLFRYDKAAVLELRGWHLNISIYQAIILCMSQTSKRVCDTNIKKVVLSWHYLLCRKRLHIIINISYSYLKHSYTVRV